MQTFWFKYENGAVFKTAEAQGADVYDAIRNSGVATDADRFMQMRVITWGVK